ILARLLPRPAWVEIHPGHVGGSACGAGISSNPSSTIGFERRHNPLLNGDGRDFVDRVLADLSPAPAEFARIYEENKRGRETLKSTETFGATGSTVRATESRRN